MVRLCGRALHVVLALAAAAPAAAGPPFARPPDATVDLTTTAGVAAVAAEWRYRDAEIVEVAFMQPGPDGRPGTVPNRTYDLLPRAGAADHDDSSWEVIAPETLVRRRAGGQVCFAWYRIALTVPRRLGSFDPTGATAVLDIVVDDYAEVWVDGALPRALGQRGGSLVAGFNAPNRVVVGRDVRPGQRFQIAVLAMNGPISDPPANYIWVRSARLDLYADEPPSGARPAPIIERLDARLDEVLERGARPRRIADGFRWLEGPVWDRAAGCLYFSDIPANTVYRWSAADGVSILLHPSGYSGTAPFTGREPGSNGLGIDPTGRLVLCQHGDRRVLRREFTGRTTVLADRYRGRRLNSPNDCVFAADGTMLFTDPPFGLPGGFDDPRRELEVCGVYALTPDGALTLVVDDLAAPNGLALSSDERTLYVSNADPDDPVLMAYPLDGGQRRGPGRVIFDATPWIGDRPGVPDGIETDAAGRIFLAGPGGVYVLTDDGEHLGTVLFNVPTANCTWGPDATLYITADRTLWALDTLSPTVR